jgi:hypothetical protein
MTTIHRLLPSVFSYRRCASVIADQKVFIEEPKGWSVVPAGTLVSAPWVGLYLDDSPLAESGFPAPGDPRIAKRGSLRFETGHAE